MYLCDTHHQFYFLMCRVLNWHGIIGRMTIFIITSLSNAFYACYGCSITNKSSDLQGAMLFLKIKPFFSCSLNSTMKLSKKAFECVKGLFCPQETHMRKSVHLLPVLYPTKSWPKTGICTVVQLNSINVIINHNITGI